MAKTATKKPTGKKPSEKPAEGEFNPAAMAANSQQKEPPATEAVPSTSDAVKLAIAIEVDQLFVAGGYCTRRVQPVCTPREAAAAKMLACVLNAKNAKVPSGRSSVNPVGVTVETAPDAVRYLLNLVADAIEAETGSDLTTDYDLSFR